MNDPAVASFRLCFVSTTTCRIENAIFVRQAIMRAYALVIDCRDDGGLPSRSFIIASPQDFARVRHVFV